jgi:hypothetical protein
MKLIVLDGVAFNPDAIDIVLDGGNGKCVVIFRNAKAHTFDLSPQEFAEKVRARKGNQP